MTSSRRILIVSMTVAALAAAVSPAFAQDTERPDAEGEKPAPVPVFYFRDQSKVAGEPELEQLRVRTSYGELSIPRADLVRVRLAQRVTEVLKEEIRAKVVLLASSDEEEATAAMKALRDIGPPALPMLRKALRAPNRQLQQRTEELLNTIMTAARARASSLEDTLERLDGEEDEVVTRRMTLRGRVLHDTFRVRSRYGILEARAESLAGIVFEATAGGGPMTLKVDARYQAPGNWLKTKLEVSSGQRLRITASGSMTVDNYGVASTPSGIQGYPSPFQNLPSLALVAKIGTSGTPFLVGPSYKGAATRSGPLYLAVIPFVYYPTGAAGTYDVKITPAAAQ